MPFTPKACTYILIFQCQVAQYEREEQQDKYVTLIAHEGRLETSGFFPSDANLGDAAKVEHNAVDNEKRLQLLQPFYVDKFPVYVPE